MELTGQRQQRVPQLRGVGRGDRGEGGEPGGGELFELGFETLRPLSGVGGGCRPDRVAADPVDIESAAGNLRLFDRIAEQVAVCSGDGGCEALFAGRPLDREGLAAPLVDSGVTVVGRIAEQADEAGPHPAAGELVQRDSGGVMHGVVVAVPVVDGLHAHPGGVAEDQHADVEVGAVPLMFGGAVGPAEFGVPQLLHAAVAEDEVVEAAELFIQPERLRRCGFRAGRVVGVGMDRQRVDGVEEPARSLPFQPAVVDMGGA